MAERDSANQAFFDALLRHQIYLLRYSGQLRNHIYKVLDSTEEDIAMLIRDRLRNSNGLTTPAEIKRLQALYESIAKIRGRAWAQIDEYTAEQLSDLAQSEPLFVQLAVNTSIPVVLDTVLPQAGMLKAIVTNNPFEGRTLKEWAKTMQDDDLRRIRSIIQVGMIEGQSAPDIARRVTGSTVLKGADGVTEISRRQVQAIVRTAVQHVANSSRAVFLKENSDVFEQEQFVATLDSRTTPVCRANDGKRFAIGKGPRPPLHYACRSLRIAYFDGVLLGQRPAKPSTEKQLIREFNQLNGTNASKRADLPKGTKGQYDKWARKRVRELTGQVPADETYQTWLTRQSKQFQEDILGVQKAKLFRDGKLPLDRFINRNGDELTLAEIAVRDRQAFIDAGLDPDDF